jgi:hypothetical protein
MRRHEGNSAGAHFRTQKQPDPRRFRDGSQTPKIRFGDRHHYVRGAPEAFHPRRGGLSRGGDSIPRSSRTRRPRYARRDRHDLSHRSRPPVGAPAERSIPDPMRALLARGAQPRGTSARWSHAFAPRGAGLSFGSTAWPNVSRPRERLRRRGEKYVQSRISASDVVCPSQNALFQRLGAVAQATGAPLSGATGRSSPGAGARATAGGRRHRFFRGRHDSRGRRAGRP